MSFGTVLIANRGEIARRVIRTARALGYRTVAVYSDADAGAPHAREADAAVRIGAAPPGESYLNIEAIVAAARASGADAIHPGYGFLSERADFARACADAGLRFIGPGAAAIEAMGSKSNAKRLMRAAGVPCVPGYLGGAGAEGQGDAILAAEAARLGFPLLVKAIAGGGGRGMRRVDAAAELAAALHSARREAASAFGDAALMLEKLIEGGRHIEVQVFGDTQGQVLHLGERDCTAQRRRQKVIEETPSPSIPGALRAALCRDAVAAARAVGYVGAGTVEFIVDADDRHYFLEMNTRLQVEHPVTEMVTGLDLVEWQLRVAAGEPLPLTQDEIRFDGHAIEVRLYAEDPYDGFKPQTGRVLHWRPAAALRPGLRIDAGIEQGDEIGPHYDAMVAKLIAHGRDRDDAIRRLRAALADAPLLGVASNGGFLRELLDLPEFRAATIDVGFLDRMRFERPLANEDDWRVAAAILALGDGVAEPRPASVASWGMALMHGAERRVPRIATAGRTATVDGVPVVLLDAERLRIDGVERRIAWHREGATVWLARAGAVFAFAEATPYPQAGGGVDPLRARAPVAGLVAQLLVRVGDKVAEGQALLSVEAMKMEMWLTAGAAGVVRAVHVAPRDAVASGAVLVELEEVDA